MHLHDLALDIGIAVDHSTYDTLYLAFAVAMGASAVVAADGPFLRSIRIHPAIMMSLDAWARSQSGGAALAE